MTSGWSEIVLSCLDEENPLPYKTSFALSDRFCSILNLKLKDFGISRKSHIQRIFSSLSVKSIILKSIEKKNYYFWSFSKKLETSPSWHKYNMQWDEKLNFLDCRQFFIIIKFKYYEQLHANLVVTSYFNDLNISNIW